MLAPIAALAALAFIALPGTASADSLGTWKVVGGHIDQTNGWKTVSQHDDGCWTTTWRDSGTADASLAAKDQKLALQDRVGGEFVKGDGLVAYEGDVSQDSQYSLRYSRDRPGDQCGPPIESAPDTSGCGTANGELDVSFLVTGDQAEPEGALSKFGWLDPCPSDSTLSNLALAAPSQESLRKFRRKDEVRLSGQATNDSPKYATGPGTDQIDNAQHTYIEWSLRFKKVRQHHRRHHH